MMSLLILRLFSNDPMGADFESVTMEINYKATIRLAKAAKTGWREAIYFCLEFSIY